MWLKVEEIFLAVSFGYLGIFAAVAAIQDGFPDLPGVVYNGLPFGWLVRLIVDIL